MKMHESANKKELFIELRGFYEKSLDSCSEELKVSKATLLKWEKELIDSITDLKRTRFGLLIDSLELGIVSRLNRLKELSDALNKELKSRNLQDMTTDKLIKYFLDSETQIDEIIQKNDLIESKETPQIQTLEEYLRSVAHNIPKC